MKMIIWIDKTAITGTNIRIGWVREQEKSISAVVKRMIEMEGVDPRNIIVLNFHDLDHEPEINYYEVIAETKPPKQEKVVSNLVFRTENLVTKKRIEVKEIE